MGTGPAHETQGLVRQIQIVLNKLLQFARLVRGRLRGDRGLVESCFLAFLDMFFSWQDEHLLRRVAPRHAV